MRHDLSKPNYGGYYEATAGSSALKGEDKLACIKRELFEETGIISERYLNYFNQKRYLQK